LKSLKESGKGLETLFMEKRSGESMVKTIIIDEDEANLIIWALRCYIDTYPHLKPESRKRANKLIEKVK
jgi:hypothetical protein